MKHLLLALALLACCAMRANKVDSLRAVASDPHRPDTVRLSAFTKMIWKGYLFSDPDSARILADSLYRMAMRKDRLADAGDAYTIRGISYMIVDDLKGAVVELQKAADLYAKAGAEDGLASVENNMGNAYWKMGDLSRAIELYTKSLQFSEKRGEKGNMAKGELNIGLIYADLRDTLRAQAHWKRALELSTSANDLEGIGQAAFNLSGSASGSGDTTAAAAYIQQAIQAFASVGNTLYHGAALQHLGQLHMKMEHFAEAHRWIDSSLVVLAPLGGGALISGKIALADLWRVEGQPDKALRIAEGMRAMADTTATLTEAKNLYQVLYESYEAKGATAPAFESYKHYQLLVDSMGKDENRSGLLRQEYKYTGEKRALADSLSYSADKAVQLKEIQKQKVMRNGFMFGFALVIAFAGVFFFQRNRIAREKERSEELLLNILPYEVAEELKAKGAADAQLIEQVTVLFTDFKGFTAMSEQLSPKELVRDIHECFSAFDHIMAKHGIEKIKTIGDAYMAAGGLPTPNNTHALDVVKAALEIRDFIAEGKARKVAAGLPYFEIRIGVHTGPVVAGIVGVKKFAYDIWGDTVNTASRMESSGEVGQVNISEATYELVKNETALTFAPRGKVQAKGKGEMEMYFVENR